MSDSVLIVDYGLGNLFNIQSAFEALGASVKISGKAEDLLSAKRILVPGVGAFADAMKGLHERGLSQPLKEIASTGRPMLGVCLGMQLLLSHSEEWGHHEGLNLVKGRVLRLKEPLPGLNYKIPHIGWNSMKLVNKSSVLDGVATKLGDEFFMYFIHSYYVALENASEVLATTEYGRDTFCSAFQSKNIIGFQPHPERSGEAGLQVYKNFLAL